MAEQPPVHRIVKARRTGYTHLPIVAVDHRDDVALDEAGEVTDLRTFMSRLQLLPSSIIVAPDAAYLLALLDDQFSTQVNWQYRVTPVKRHVMRANGALSDWKVGHTLVNFFGFRRETGRGTNRYHYPIDPYTFMRGATMLEDVIGHGETPRVVRLMEWAQNVREWCKTQDLRITPTSGGLAAQLLRDKRWFPEERRKVPRATNEKVRPRLPGNYYRLFADVDSPYEAYYLDMKASHHTIAATTTFPDPDSLVARGYFDVSDVSGVTVSSARPWLRPGHHGFERIVHRSHGLLYARITVPPLRDHRFPPPFMRHAGSRMAWIYTNEIPMTLALGARIEWLSAAWTSFEADPSLNRYARFALEELEATEEARKRWLKPTLLAAYGLLAARPLPQETAFKRSEKGEERVYPAGPRLLRAQAMIREGEQESPIVNVMYRGMIEAEQRRRTLDLARDMHSRKLRVLAIYADSLFVEATGPLPFLPPGWRVEDVLEGLYFSSATHFTSHQLTKLPGIARDSSERVQLMAAMRGELPGIGFAPFPRPPELRA